MKLRALAVAFALTAITALPVQAVPVLVGSWFVGQAGAPEWDSSPPNGPLAYTGLEAAILLFGATYGTNPSIYSISTDLNSITHTAWYDQIGLGVDEFAEDYNLKYLGQFYGPTSGFAGGEFASSYVRDNEPGNNLYTNYVFVDVNPVPLPAALPLFLTGAGVLHLVRRRAIRQRAKRTA